MQSATPLNEIERPGFVQRGPAPVMDSDLDMLTLAWPYGGFESMAKAFAAAFGLELEPIQIRYSPRAYWIGCYVTSDQACFREIDAWLQAASIGEAA